MIKPHIKLINGAWLCTCDTYSASSELDAEDAYWRWHRFYISDEYKRSVAVD